MSDQFSRRDFIKKTAIASAITGIGIDAFATSESHLNSDNDIESAQKIGVQRLPVSQLEHWQELGYGMFIHFGMSTFSGDELGSGKDPCSLYNPTELDVDQWVKVARDAGMKYIVLTAKHVSGHCLWPSKYTDYHVGNSGNKTDVMEAFVSACKKYDIQPGLYYCSWDNHHLFGSATPSNVPWESKFTTPEYCDFQFKQVEELMTQYGPFVEVWIDIPGMLSYENRLKQYQLITELQPDILVMMNGGVGKEHQIKTDYSWPTDLVSMERGLPPSRDGYNPWYVVKDYLGNDQDYYIPGEVCDTICYTWFWNENIKVRSAEELVGMRLISKERGSNFLLNVAPDQTGRIPQKMVDVLLSAKLKYDKIRRAF